jgi:5'-nucleotidase/UDP-sugar diphosphatase
MKRFQKLTIVAVIIALIVMMLPAAFVFAEGGRTLVIFHTNDIHGRAVDNVEKCEIGYARYKTILDLAEDEFGDTNVLAFDAGDALHGTNFATLSKGESIVRLMNMVGIDAMACGNHEFNYGKDRLKELEALANFPIMAVNVLKEDGEAFFNTNSQIFEVFTGHAESDPAKFGVIGVATPETKVKAHPKYTEGLTFGAGEEEKTHSGGSVMGYIQGDDRRQQFLLPRSREDCEHFGLIKRSCPKRIANALKKAARNTLFHSATSRSRKRWAA